MRALLVNHVGRLIEPLARTVRHRRHLVAVVLAIWAFTVLLAVAIPLSTPDPDSSHGVFPEPTTSEGTAVGEDLSVFLASKRWGTSLEEIQRKLANATGEPENKTPDELGYVGFLAGQDRTTVLLRLPDGSLDERHVGDALPDGRKISALEDTRLRLNTGEQHPEELLLFPQADDPEQSARGQVPEDQ